MAWSESENKKAGWLQKKLRLREADAANLATVADLLNLNQSEAVAELCRRFLKKVKR